MKTCFLLMVEGATTRDDLLRCLPAGAVLQELSTPKIGTEAQTAELQFDEAQRCVHKGSSQIMLTHAEYRLICLLAAQPGKVWGQRTAVPAAVAATGWLQRTRYLEPCLPFAPQNRG